MRTASQNLLDLVLQAHQCTDYRAAKLLSVSKGTVSWWRTGSGHMSTSNVQKACELAGVGEETWWWHIVISAEREKGPDGDIYREAAEDLQRVARGERPSKTGVMQLAVRAFRKYMCIGAVSIGLMSSMLGYSSPAKALAASDIDENGQVCILRQIGGVGRKRRKAA